VQAFKEAIGKLKNKMVNMIARAVINAIKDDGEIQRAQINLGGDLIDDVPIYFPHGFSSFSSGKSQEAIVLKPEGISENAIILAVTDRENRFKKLKQGQTVIYADDKTYILLSKDDKNGGTIEIKSSGKLLITAEGGLRVIGKGEKELIGLIEEAMDKIGSVKVVNHAIDPTFATTMSEVRKTFTDLKG
jgi:phage gp45-like